MTSSRRETPPLNTPVHLQSVDETLPNQILQRVISHLTQSKGFQRGSLTGPILTQQNNSRMERGKLNPETTRWEKAKKLAVAERKK